MPLISVIIPCFNAERWIKETLQSVLIQGVDTIEIVVIDDSSMDRSVDIIKGEFPGVKIIRQERGGASRARNLGTKESRGEYIQYLDADDLLAPRKIKNQLELLQSSGADVCYGNWQRLSEAKSGSFIKTDKIERSLQNPEIDLFTDFWCPPAAYLFKRSIVEKTGGWNERLPVIQDARFVLDCALHKARFVYYPDIAAYYRTHKAGSLSRRDPVAFNRDIFNNALEIEVWWKNHEGITEIRKKALLNVYGYVARSSFERDKPTFESAYKRLEALRPGYIPEKPRHLRLASQLLGYRRAEAVARLYRYVKGAFS